MRQSNSRAAAATTLIEPIAGSRFFPRFFLRSSDSPIARPFPPIHLFTYLPSFLLSFFPSFLSPSLPSFLSGMFSGGRKILDPFVECRADPLLTDSVIGVSKEGGAGYRAWRFLDGGKKKTGKKSYAIFRIRGFASLRRERSFRRG